MGFNHGYGPGPGADEATHLMRKAFDLGCTFYDTAEGYGAGENERLVGRALAPIRNKVVLATKFFIREPLPGAALRKEIRTRLDASLARPITSNCTTSIAFLSPYPSRTSRALWES